MVMKIHQKLLVAVYIIGAIVRDQDVIIANASHSIEQGDHVIMFITDKKYVPEVEKLFQPSPFFL